VAAPVAPAAGASTNAALSKAAGAAADRMPDVDRLLYGDPPVSTTFGDADPRAVLPDTFGARRRYTPLTKLARTAAGGFVLRPGFFELELQSYCLRAGTHGPSRSAGSGYLNAPLKGSGAGIVRAILQRSVARPEIPQEQIQLLLWAIIARAKPRQLSPPIALTATKLLTPEELASMEAGSVGVLSEAILERAGVGLPEPARRALATENALRGRLTDASYAFADAERIAVTAGDAPPEAGAPEVPRGRWSLHPDGFYIRYLPSSYRRTLVQLYVPASLFPKSKGGGEAAGPEYDPSGSVGVPANAGAQRLGQSGRGTGTGGAGAPGDNPAAAGGGAGGQSGGRPGGGAGGGMPTPHRGEKVNPDRRRFDNCADAARTFEANANNEAFRTGQARWTLDVDPNTAVTARPGQHGYEASATVNYQVNGKQVDVPDWSWPNMSDAERAALARYRDALFVHEEGHLQIADDFARQESGKTVTATGSTPAEAKVNLQRALSDLLDKKRNDLQRDEDSYDDQTEHGGVQHRGPDAGYPGGEDVVFTCP
jgi:hypothetical protein